MYNWSDIKSIKPITDSEEIQLITREHPIVLALRWFASAFLILLFYTFGYTLQASSVDISLIHTYWSIGYFVVAAIMLVLALHYHNYYLSKQIITNLRIIDIDQTGLFSVSSTDVFINEIEEVNFKQSSFWQGLLNFGSVDIETAGTPTQLAVSGSVFENIPNPRSVVTLLNRLQHEDKVVHPGQNN